MFLFKKEMEKQNIISATACTFNNIRHHFYDDDDNDNDDNNKEKQKSR